MAIASSGATRRKWEGRFGCFAALSLSVLEVKRLLLLALEMLVDSRAIRFAGALVPFVFSFVDVGLGFPVAVAALLSMRKQQVQPCYPNKKRGLRRIASILTICLILNVVTLILIGCKVTLDVDLLREAFSAAMRLYAKNASCKLVVDELQLDLQCCGFSTYADWFSFDWQGMDYEDSAQGGNKDDEEERSVPFSCCSRRATLPCSHEQMRDEDGDARTVNNLGCAIALSRILFKIAVVGYAMTGLIVCTQLALIFFLIRIIQKVMPDICPSDCTCWEPSCPMTGPIINTSSDEYTSGCQGNVSRYRDPCRHTCTPTNVTKPRKVCRRPRVARKFCGSTTTSKCSTTRSAGTTSCCSSSDSSSPSPSSSSSYARLTSSPSFVPKRSDKASMTTTSNTHVQRQVPAKAQRKLGK